MSEEKFSKCEEREREKKYKCGVSGVRKKRIGRKILREKKSKCFLGKKLRFRCIKRKLKLWKLELRLQRKFKIRDFYLLGSYPLVGRHVVKHG